MSVQFATCERVHDIEHCDWHVRVLAFDPGYFEYQIERPDGVKVEVSDSGYGSPFHALRDGMVRLSVYLNGAEHTARATYALTGSTSHWEV